MKSFFFLITVIALIFLNGCKNNMEKADLIAFNGTIFTVDSVFSTAEAMAVRTGKIVAVGSNRNIQNHYTATRKINLHGNYVYPGFIDAHCHFFHYGLSLRYANLTGTRSFEEVLERLKQYHAANISQWVLGRGWDQNDWKVKKFPNNRQLDSLFPDQPVLLTRIDGHAALANNKALEIAGIGSATSVNGGEIKRVAGKPTGILLDNAITLVSKFVPEPDEKEKIQALLQAQRNCFAVGLTTISDAGLNKDEIELIDSLQHSGDLKMQVYAMLSPGRENFDKFMFHGIYKTNRLHICSIKLYADGALGSRGAKLFTSYSDDPGNSGYLVNSPEKLRNLSRLAYKYGYQVNTHCIGDSANRLMLTIYSDILGGSNDRRWRIEHAQVIHPDDFHLFRDFNIIPSIQTTHATSDMYWAEERLGPERIKGAYAYHTLLVQNGWLANGSDFPVEDINPLLGFYAAITRQDTTGYPPGGFQKENALNREQAMRAMTIWAAKADFEDQEKGSIESGKKADFVILRENLMTVNPREIPRIKIMNTYLSGEEVYPGKN